MARMVLPLHTPRYIPTGKELAVFKTSKGNIKVALFGKDAPHTVGNFIELARRGFYDEVKFHARDEESALVGGCPTTKSLGPAQVHAAVKGLIYGLHPGRGNAGYTIRDEFEGRANNKHLLGSLVMARGTDANTGSCQFYFSLGEQPEHDNSFTVFGQTIEGLEVLKELRIGDAIHSIDIEGADEEALTEALSFELPTLVPATNAGSEDQDDVEAKVSAE